MKHPCGNPTTAPRLFSQANYAGSRSGLQVRRKGFIRSEQQNA
jgi:hypothetical protein